MTNQVPTRLIFSTTGLQSVFLQCVAVIFVLRLYRKEAEAEVEADKLLPMAPQKPTVLHLSQTTKRIQKLNAGTSYS